MCLSFMFGMNLQYWTGRKRKDSFFIYFLFFIFNNAMLIDYLSK